MQKTIITLIIISYTYQLQCQIYPFWINQLKKDCDQPIKEIDRGNFGIITQVCDTVIKTITIKNQKILKQTAKELEVLRHFNQFNISKMRDNSHCYYNKNNEQNEIYFDMIFYKEGNFHKKIYNEAEEFPNRSYNLLHSALWKFDMVYKICQVLQSFHTAYAHLDLKLENILFFNEYTPILTDFGASQNAFVSENVINYRSEIVGTFVYLPFEILTGNYNPLKADIFSLGIVFYEILTGALLDRDPSMKKASQEFYDLLDDQSYYPQIYEYFHELIIRMTKEEPIERPDIDEIIEYLFDNLFSKVIKIMNPDPKQCYQILFEYLISEQQKHNNLDQLIQFRDQIKISFDQRAKNYEKYFNQQLLFPNKYYKRISSWIDNNYNKIEGQEKELKQNVNNQKRFRLFEKRTKNI